MARLDPRGEAGFSLPELMVSLAVLSITLATTLTASSTAQHLFYHEKLVTQAIAIGETVTEELLLLDASDDALLEGVHEATYSRFGAAAGDASSLYTARWTISPWEDVPGIRRIEIRVSWLESDQPREIQWTTYRN